MTLVRRVEYLEARTRPVAGVVAPLPLAEAADVLAVLGEQINAVRADAAADPTEKARTLALLAGVALRAIEAKDVAARLEAVERVLKLRRDNERDEKRRKPHGR